MLDTLGSEDMLPYIFRRAIPDLTSPPPPAAGGRPNFRSPSSFSTWNMM